MKKILPIINLLEDTFFVTSLFVIGFVVADIIIPEKITFFRNILSFMCHQQPERCFFILNKPIELCTRCLGIYLGFAVFYKGINQLERYPPLYYFSALYILIDLVIELGLGLSANNTIRFFFGLFLSFFTVWTINLLRSYAVRNWQTESLQIKPTGG